MGRKLHVWFLFNIWNIFIPYLQNMSTSFANACFKILIHYLLKDSSKYKKILGTMINQGKSSHKYLLDSSLSLSLSFSFSLSHQSQGMSGLTWQLSRGICSQLFWSNALCLCDDKEIACFSSKAGNALFFLWSLKGNSWVERWEDSP